MTKYVRKLGKAGKYSCSITLPMEVVRELGWKFRQKVCVTRKGKEILIRDWKK